MGAQGVAREGAEALFGVLQKYFPKANERLLRNKADELATLKVDPTKLESGLVDGSTSLVDVGTKTPKGLSGRLEEGGAQGAIDVPYRLGEKLEAAAPAATPVGRAASYGPAVAGAGTAAAGVGVMANAGNMARPEGAPSPSPETPAAATAPAAATPPTAKEEIFPADVAAEVGGGATTSSTTPSPTAPAPTPVTTVAKPERDVSTFSEVKNPKDLQDQKERLDKMQGFQTADGRTILLSDPDAHKELAIKDANALAAWNARYEVLRNDYQEAKERIGLAEAAEVLGKAIARIGAGLYGMRTGYSVAGADFSPSDWSKRYDLAYQSYKADLAQAEKVADATRQGTEAIRRDAEQHRTAQGTNAAALARAQAEGAGMEQGAKQHAEGKDLQVDLFNAGQVNRGAELDATLEERRQARIDALEARKEAAEARADARIAQTRDPVEKARLEVQKGMTLKAFDRHTKEQSDADGAVAILQDAVVDKKNTTAGPKAMADLAKAYDKATFQAALERAKKKTGLLNVGASIFTGEWSESARKLAGPLMKELESVPRKKAPTFDDFAQSATTGAPAGAAPSPAQIAPPTGKTTTMAEVVKAAKAKGVDPNVFASQLQDQGITITP